MSEGAKRVVKIFEKFPKHKMIMDPKGHRMAHPVYSMRDIEVIEQTHHQPQNFRDRWAKFSVWSIRMMFDLMTRFDKEKMTEKQWLNRVIFLETVAGVPGLVGAMTRHLRSLRSLKRDHGWIHHLLEEAENERVHLFIFLQLKQPNLFFKAFIAGSQAIFFNMYFWTYLFSPKMAHRFVGYLEEQAVHTYTIMLDQIDSGKLPGWA